MAKHKHKLDGYVEELAALEAVFLALDLQPDLIPQAHNPNFQFARNEMNRLIMEVLLEADSPIPLPVIIKRVLTAKGHTRPVRTLECFVRHRMTARLSVLQDRGIVVRVIGSGWALKT